MKTIRVSATEARNDFFTLLNKVIFGGVKVIITKAGADKPAILTSEIAVEDADIKKRMAELNKTYGILKDSPAENFQDERLRGKKAEESLTRLRNNNSTRE